MLKNYTIKIGTISYPNLTGISPCLSLGVAVSPKEYGRSNGNAQRPSCKIVKEFFEPKSICLIGASADKNRIGGRPISYLKAGGFAGTIYPVNSNRTEVQGIPAFPSVRALPARPDLAVIALPRDIVLPALEDCVEMEIPAVIIFSSGFAEFDERGRELQEAVAKRIAGRRTRVLGPNSNGTMVPRLGVYCCLTSLLQRGLPASGRAAILTQSAGLGTALLDQCRRRDIGVVYWGHTGNEVDVTLLDLMSYVIDDPLVNMVMVTSEVLRDPSKLKDILVRAAARNVKISLVQVGRSELGGIAAASHTGALVAAQSVVTRGLFRQGGAWHTDSMRNLVNAAEARQYIGKAAGLRIGILTTSGGMGIMLADVLESVAIDAPRLSGALQERLRAEAPYIHPGNPVDLTAQMVREPERFRGVLSALIASGEVDVIVTFLPVSSEQDPVTLELVDAVQKSNARGSTVRFALVGSVEESGRQFLHRAGVAVWDEPSDFAAAMSAMKDLPPDRLLPPLQLEIRSHREDGKLPGTAGESFLGEIASKSALRKYGLVVVADRQARTPDAAGEAADQLGYPVALKLHVPGLAHKARMGGVRLGIQSRAAAIAAAKELLESAAAGPQAALLVEPMVPGFELFIGVTDHKDFGLIAICGLGGGEVEKRRQVAYRWMPVSEGAIADMLAEAGVMPLLELTSRTERALREIRRIFSAAQELMSASGGRLSAIDINPVMVGVGGECTIVDALIELAPPRA